MLKNPSVRHVPRLEAHAKMTPETPMPPLVTSALDPVRADPNLFVGRHSEAARIHDLLTDLVLGGECSARIGLHGPIGIGKTILTRKILRQLQSEHGDRFILAEVDCRGLGYRPFLKRLARTLTEEGQQYCRRLSGSEQARLGRTLDELGRLALHDTITEHDTQSIARSYGIDAGVQGGIMGVLQGRGLAKWNETRLAGQTLQRSVQVSDDLLHAALEAFLGQCADAGIPVLIFLNDLDQAVRREAPDTVRETLAKLVSIEPCVQVINLRTEVLFDDLRREVDLHEIGPMPANQLLQLFAERRTRALPEKRKRLESASVQRLAEQLSRANGNPFAYLWWLYAALRSFDPEEINILEDQVRTTVVGTLLGFPEHGLLSRAATVVDRVSENWDDWCTRDELKKGRRRDEGIGPGPNLTEAEIDRLVLDGVLVPRDIFAVERGLRLTPRMDLLRPSVIARLKEA